MDLTIKDWAAVQAKARRYRGFNPKWYVNSEVYYGAMVGLMAAAGGNTMQTLANGDSQPIFLGKPVEFVELLENDLGVKATTIFGYYGDLSLAVEMGDARGVTIASDSSVYFKEDALGVRGTQRYDIVVHGIGTTTRADSMVAIKTA
jgi:HK97 family phage major capsid protein